MLKEDDARNSFNDRRYDVVPRNLIPRAESLKLTLKRTLPFWKNQITKAVLSGNSVLVVAHGNSIRAIVKHVENISNDSFYYHQTSSSFLEILKVEIPNGTPLLYEFDSKMKAKRGRVFLE